MTPRKSWRIKVWEQPDQLHTLKLNPFAHHASRLHKGQSCSQWTTTRTSASKARSPSQQQGQCCAWARRDRTNPVHMVLVSANWHNNYYLTYVAMIQASSRWWRACLTCWPCSASKFTSISRTTLSMCIRRQLLSSWPLWGGNSYVDKGSKCRRIPSLLRIKQMWLCW